MREIDTDKILIYGVSILLVILLVPVLSRFKRTKGKNPIYHGIFVISSILTLIFLPNDIQYEIFSPGGVIVIGTILPIYSSIVSVCTPGEGDDLAWLQYWITSGTLSYTTEFIDEIREYFPMGGEHWYEFEFFLTLWLLLPFTDGSALIYDKFTEPYIAPTARKIKSKCEGWMQIILAVVNTWHLWIVWFTFISLEEEQRRFIVVGVGTIYPMAASTVAVATKSDQLDETYWLTYWSCYSILFLCMDYLENFVGHITGFYSLCLVGTIYLFLPMFNGSETIFRRILVPLSGQYENMLLHDAYLVRRSMEKSIPSQYHDRIFEKAAKVFQEKTTNKEKEN